MRRRSSTTTDHGALALAVRKCASAALGHQLTVSSRQPACLVHRGHVSPFELASNGSSRPTGRPICFGLCDIVGSASTSTDEPETIGAEAIAAVGTMAGSVRDYANQGYSTCQLSPKSPRRKISRAEANAFIAQALFKGTSPPEGYEFFSHDRFLLRHARHLARENNRTTYVLVVRAQPRSLSFPLP